MNFFVGNEVPFQYFKYDVKKDIPMSGELRNDFSNYYRQISELATDIDIDKLISDLSEQYSVLRSKLITEIQLSGDKKTIHTEEEIDFIFWCSYLLLDKFKLSQSKVERIFGFSKPFGESDLFPDRCHSAFAKNDYISLIPNKTDTVGIEIARVINKRIQAVYACREFWAINNDTDIFVNTADAGKKQYVLTSPLNFASDDVLQIERANYAYANFLFAMGNNIYDGDIRTPAGEIKECIIKLLEMKDLSLIEQDSVLADIFSSDKDLSAFVTAGNYGTFSRLRKEYQWFVETVNLANEYEKEGVIPYGVEYYDSHFGGSSVDDGAEKWEELWGGKEEQDISTEEIILSAREKALHRIQQLLPQLVAFLDVRKLLSSNDAILKSWIEIIRKRVKEELIYSVVSVDDKGQEGSVLAVPPVEDRINAAASYWISEVFNHIEVSNESIDGVLQWLKETLTARLKNFINMRADGEMTSEEYKVARLDVDKRLEEIDNIISKCELEKGKKQKKLFDLQKIKDRLDTYIDLSGYKVSSEMIDMFVERIIYRGNDEFLWVMNLSGDTVDTSAKYRINGYSKEYSDSLKDDKNFNIVYRAIIPLEVCQRYCERDLKRRFVPKYWKPITIKIAIQ